MARTKAETKRFDSLVDGLFELDDDNPFLSEMQEQDDVDSKSAKYSPDQPRLPAGAPGGGQFAGSGSSMSVSSVPAATTRLASGKKTEVTGDLVPGILEHFAGVDKHANLADLHVKGTELYDQSMLRLSRAEMPQIPNTHKQQFADEMAARGIAVSKLDMAPLALKPIQAELSANRSGKLMQMMRNGHYDQTNRIVVSKDNFILDGHHRWAGATGLEFSERASGKPDDVRMPVLKIGLKATELLHEARDFNDRHGIAARDMGADDLHLGKVAGDDTNFFPAEWARDFNADQPRDDHGRWTSEGGGALGSQPSQSSADYPKANPDGKDTQQFYKRKDGTYTPERAALHKKILDDLAATSVPREHPIALMTGGGPAAGKSSITNSGLVKLPDNPLRVEGDEIKKQLPEFREMKKAKMANAAAFVHEESADISRAAIKRAADGHYNIVADITGDSSIENLSDKVAAMRAGGAKVVAHYVTVDTETAIARNRHRGSDAGSDPGRIVPEADVRSIHRGVSQTLPKALSKDLFDEVKLWDNNERTPRLVLSKTRGQPMVVHEPALYQKFLDKGR